MVHWICPLYKRKAKSNPANYRGVHLTAQISKVVERVFADQITPFLEASGAYGPNQYAYARNRGYRDALAHIICVWIREITSKRRVALYCSDVAAAFDRVDVARLVSKLRSKGIHPQVVSVIDSWLQQRVAHVVVEGSLSVELLLRNMIFQGTVFGPILWNCFYEDARASIEKAGFCECVFADDLNSYRTFPAYVGDRHVLRQLVRCQAELHDWGKANGVSFDAAKEHHHIIDATCPHGDHFDILGVEFDPRLNMYNAILKIAAETGRRLAILLRTHRFYNAQSLVKLYKAHVLPYAERSTPAIFHASAATLKLIDDLQRKFLSELQISPEEAILNFNLAPLAARRHISTPGLLHRVRLGLAPKSLADLFPMARTTMLNYISTDRIRHGYQFENIAAPGSPAILRRSIFAMTGVYNNLPIKVVEATSVKVFQKRCQFMLKEAAANADRQWEDFFKP